VINEHPTFEELCQTQYVGMRILTNGLRLRRRSRRRRFSALAFASLVLVTAVAAGAYLWREQPGNPLRALATTEEYPPALVQFRFRGGSGTSTHAFEAELKSATRKLASGAYSDAIPALEQLLKTRPGEHEIAAYLGISRYLAAENGEDVRKLLERGMSDDLDYVRRAARWYLANLHLRRGETERAVAHLRHPDFAESAGIYSRLAAGLLDDISSTQK